MIEWKECEHEFNDNATFENPQARVSLRNCGLLKYFKLQKMKKEVLLLEYLIGLWDDVEQAFRIWPQLFKFELDDVYFLTDLSRRGAPILLSGHWATPHPTEVYVADHYILGSRLVGGWIVIKVVRNLALRSILFSITNMAGSMSAHLASKSQMSYSLQCVEPRLFNWSAGFLRNVKEQITKCRIGRHKQFGYDSFLVSLFLERIPQMHLQIVLIAQLTTEPHMERWTSLSPILGNEASTFNFTTDFFTWWIRKLIIIQDFPYAEVDFWGSVDLVLLEGIDWDVSSTKPNLVMYFWFYILYYFMCTKLPCDHCKVTMTLLCYVMARSVWNLAPGFGHYHITHHVTDYPFV